MESRQDTIEPSVCKALIIGSSNYQDKEKILTQTKEDVKAVGAFLRQQPCFGEDVFVKIDKLPEDVDKTFNEEFF